MNAITWHAFQDELEKIASVPAARPATSSGATSTQPKDVAGWSTFSNARANVRASKGSGFRALPTPGGGGKPSTGGMTMPKLPPTGMSLRPSAKPVAGPRNVIGQ